MVTGFRRLVPLLVVAAAIGAGCQPAKKGPPPAPGLFVAHYLSSDSAGYFRSTAPHARPLAGGATAAQQLLPDGSVALGLAELGNVTNGGTMFLTVPVRLGDVHTIQLQLASNCCEGVALELWLDESGDGELFTWDPNGFGGSNGFLTDEDDIAYTPHTPALSIAIDDATTLEVLNGSFTLGQIKAGAWKPTIDADTLVAIGVRFNIFDPPPDDGVIAASALRVNGLDVLVP
jgi:hypothetical protein